MNRWNVLQGVALCGLMILTGQRGQASVGLADWCVNLNGDINTACNGAGGGGVSPGGGTISLSSFDTTLEPGTNSLGKIVVTLVPGMSQYVSFYADYDVDYASLGSFQDYGTVNGAPPSGVTYELDDPNSSNIFSDFAGNTLMNTNNVGTGVLPPNVCCDVSWALGIGGINVPSGGSGTVTFGVSTVQPTSGFYLQQTNIDTGDSIYLSVSESTSAPCTGPNCVPTVPEPSFAPLLVLAAGGLGMAIAFRKRVRS